MTNEIKTAYSVKAWRQYVGATAYPTIALFAIALAVFVLSTYFTLQGSLSFVWTIVLNSIAIYLLFTPAHEAVHGNIKGKNRKLTFLENTIGWISSLSFTAPLPVFSYVHLEHHDHTNHPEDDPDFWVAGQNFFVVVLKCSSIIFAYHFHYWKGTKKHWENDKSGFVISIIVFAIEYCGAIYWGLTMGWAYPVFIWILPAWIATSFLAYVFDYLPHHPHAVQKRYLDTRIMLYPGLSTILLSQNMHLIHHLHPNIPFYHYGNTFEAIREKLEEKGSKIEGKES